MPRRGATPPRPTIVLYVRHGTTPTTGRLLPGRAPGLHLSDQGRAEAARVAERIGALPDGTVEAVYASTLERAQETAAAIATAVGRSVEIDADLADCDTGVWTGMELKAARKLPEWHDLERRPAGFRFPDGESFAELRARMSAVAERLQTRHLGKVVVAVSHADPIKIAVSEALGAPLDLSDRIVISPCSLTAIAYAPGGASVLAVNSTAELAALGLVHVEPKSAAARRPAASQNGSAPPEKTAGRA
jgi:broad specificity phosphatase PhoE